MVTADAVSRDLRAAGAAFGLAPVSAPALRWGSLMLALDETADEAYVVALELIYEGYLFHYGASRLKASARMDRKAALLAGDCFYAHGLHVIAARGDLASVDALARLMAACAYLRSVAAPYDDDDALWAYLVGGLVALRRGAEAAAVTRVFDQLDAAWSASGVVDVRALARLAATGLANPCPAPLLAELDGRRSPSAVAAESLAPLLTS